MENAVVAFSDVSALAAAVLVKCFPFHLLFDAEQVAWTLFVGGTADDVWITHRVSIARKAVRALTREATIEVSAESMCAAGCLAQLGALVDIYQSN